MTTAGLTEDISTPDYPTARRRLLFACSLAVAFLAGAGGLGGAAEPRPGAAAAHWSFRPIVRAAPPPVRGDVDVENSVDAFIQHRLREHGLRLAPPADRLTLIRRAFTVLHGLLPDRSVIEEYVRDSRPDWYERLVDELLASPRYGERWARHWLDVVRYAESNGFETNRPRANAYPYRDYVIGALNEDLRYDRFVLEQLAGDSVGVDAATGFLVAGLHDVVKSPDIELTLMQRSDELADFVNATASTFLGLTVACARCHDHKFDPISQRDYYSMVAVFAGVEHGERRAPSAADTESAAELARELGTLDVRLRALGLLREAVNPRENIERFEAVTAKYVRFTIEATNGAEPCIDELEVWSVATPDEPSRNVARASLGSSATASGTLSGFAIHKLEYINDGVHGNSRSWISNTPGRGWVQIELSRRTSVDRIVWARDREGRYKDRLATSYRIEVASEAPTESGAWRTVASSDHRRFDGKTPDAVFASASEEGRALLNRRRELEAEREELAARATIWAGTFRRPGKTHVLYRGEPGSPREAVGPDALARLGSLGLDENAPERERRVALARWIGSVENPLTPRVLVNRLWQHHFGRALVTTPNDFGTNGRPPSHPGLLDYLARELIESGWSIKHVQRLIIVSQTFRQASVPDEKAGLVDAGNRFLWRFAPRRVEAETIRDLILRAAGTLDLRMGGPGFEIVVARVGNVYNYETKTSFGPADWRRMVYGHFIRGERDGSFGAFDRPDGGQLAPKRARSTTALQALNLLNGPFLLQQAGLFAKRLRSEAGDDPRAQVRLAFEIVYSRKPEESELADAVALVRAHELAALCRALFNSNEFLFVF